MKKTKVKKSVAALGIFTIIMMVAWLVFFIGLCCALGNKGFSRSHFSTLKQMFSFDFVHRTGPMIMTFVLGILFVAIIIIAIVLTVKRRKVIQWIALVIYFIGCFISLEMFFNLNRAVDRLGYVYLLSDFDHPTNVLMAFGVIGTAALSLVLSIFFYFVVVADCFGKLEPKVVKQEEVNQNEQEELIRRIVREELAKRPQVNQYFYGVAPKELVNTEDVIQELKEAPKHEEKKEEPQVVDFVAPEPAPVEEEAKNPIIRIPFDERLMAAEKGLKDNYNELKNEILSYGVKSRLSNSGDTFRLHRKTYVKISIAGKGLKLYFALNPSDYAESTIPVIDVSNKGIYEETPLAFKVKSDLSVKRAKQLIADVMASENLEQGEVGNVDYVKEIRAALREEKKAQ